MFEGFIEYKAFFVREDLRVYLPINNIAPSNKVIQALCKVLPARDQQYWPKANTIWTRTSGLFEGRGLLDAYLIRHRVYIVSLTSAPRQFDGVIIWWGCEIYPFEKIGEAWEKRGASHINVDMVDFKHHLLLLSAVWVVTAITLSCASRRNVTNAAAEESRKQLLSQLVQFWSILLPRFQN
jgi:hypothetical protein